MKLLILVSILGVVACRRVPLYPRIAELLRVSTDVQHLFNETLLLITSTERLMTLTASSTRLQIDTSLTTIGSTLDAAYQSSTNYTSTLASYLVDEIKGLENSETDLESCLTILPYVQNLGQVFDDQFKVIFSTSHYTANTTLENKYTGMMQNIANVQGLRPTLSNCQLDEECILDVAEQLEEQNLALINAILDINDSTETLFEEILNNTQSSAERTQYVDEEYICNVALTIENCIQSRINNPIVTITPGGQETSPITGSTETETTPISDSTEAETTLSTILTPSDETVETETTPVPTLAPPTTLNPAIYCTHQTFSP